MRSIGRAFATAAVTVAGLLAVAAPANAAVTCSYDGGADVLTVAADADDDITFLRVVAGGEIGVAAAVAGEVACSGGPPTVDNTGDVSLINGAQSTSWFVADPEDFTGPTGEVRTIAALGGGSDTFGVFDTDGENDFWTLGAMGGNWNGDMDVDASFLGAVDQLQMQGFDGNDAITARGGQGTGNPFAGPGLFAGVGGVGNDDVEGGDASDFLSAGDGDDELVGFAGADDLESGPGTNELNGGPGDDSASYLGAGVGVTVDLAVAGPQNTGLGTDTLSGVEGLEGSNQADELSGNGDANALVGQDGNDILDGRGGNDPLNGGADVDTATYESAPAGVSVSVDAGTATGAAGDDTLVGIDDLIGSPFADALMGDDGSNTITGLGGNDTVSAEGGADDVRVRDGGPDTASCGTDVDTAIADRASVDTVDPDCETVDFPPEDGGGGGGDGEPSNDFAFGEVKRNKREGTAKLTVIVPGPGELELARTKKVKADEERADAEGSEKLLVKSKGKKRKKLRKKGKAKVNAEVTYTPDGGDPSTKSKRVKLKRR